MTQRFENKVVLVTGGGRGMGRAIVDAFVREGAKVMIAARTIKYGEEAAAEIRAAGGEAQAVYADNSDRASMKGMVDKTIECYGQLDIVVHCAADYVQGEIIDMPEDVFERMVTSNITSLQWLAKDCVPHLSKAADKGRLILISSGGANRQYVPGMNCYTATKAYMNFFAKGLASEVGKLNVLVNVVEPGLIASDRVLTHMSMDIANALTAGYPVPRVGVPEDIAGAVLYFASSDASYVTGSSLLVDGGSTMAPLADLEKVLNEAETNKTTS